MSTLTFQNYDGYEQIALNKDEESGLQAIIAIHSTRLGPAVGGCRMFPYPVQADALQDVLRLSRGMTYKSALAGLPFGGGKSVIIGDPRQDKSDALLHAMGDFVEQLGGSYLIAEDSGTSPADMQEIAQRTSFVTGIDQSIRREDPSPATALGVFLGIKAGVARAFNGNDSLMGKTVALQGMGHVGYHLARYLVEAGARVLGSDINTINLRRAERDLGVVAVAADDILYQTCDVLAPCAMGAILNEASIPRLKARVIAGAANNQLATEADDERIRGRGIIYCPDFAINAGGIVDIYHQEQGASTEARRQALASIGDRVAEILGRATQSGVGSQRVAEAMAEENIAAADSPSSKTPLRGAA